MSLYGQEWINLGELGRESGEVSEFGAASKTDEPGEGKGSSGTPVLTRARRTTLPRDWLVK